MIVQITIDAAAQGHFKNTDPSRQEPLKGLTRAAHVVPLQTISQLCNDSHDFDTGNVTPQHRRQANYRRSEINSVETEERIESKKYQIQAREGSVFS